MTKGNPFTKRLHRMPKLRDSLKHMQKQPAIGVTQGGSSRTRGAQPAATDGMARRKTEKKR